VGCLIRGKAVPGSAAADCDPLHANLLGCGDREGARRPFGLRKPGVSLEFRSLAPPLSSFRIGVKEIAENIFVCASSEVEGKTALSSVCRAGSGPGSAAALAIDDGQ